MNVVMPYFGIYRPEDWLTSCNLNRYETGGSSVAWHADDEDIFNGKDQDVRILSLPLGQQRKFDSRRRSKASRHKATTCMELGDGDLCTMEGMCQAYYQHRIPPEGTIWRPRINLTWRWMVKHHPSCTAGKGPEVGSLGKDSGKERSNAPSTQPASAASGSASSNTVPLLSHT